MNNEKKEYIAGIYNYCDRWCEKCKFTSNCRVFSTESKINTYEILHNGEFPNSEDIFKMEFEDIKENEDEFCEEDFRDDDEDFDFDEEEEDIIKSFKDKKEYPVEKFAVEYFNKTHSFLKRINDKYNFNKPYLNNREDSNNKILFDNLEIISWYHMFIMVKIKRALDGKSGLKIGMDEDDNEIESYDMNGTAKIAAIAVDNSQKALTILLSVLKEFSSEIEGLIVLLGKILNDIDLEFPDHKNFKRPGFD